MPGNHLDVITLSHLRWNGVYQRPQQLLSRFALSRRVLYIEEPENEDFQTPYLEEIRSDTTKVTVLKPRLQCGYPYYIGAQLEIIIRLVSEYVTRWAAADRYALWLYSPMAMPVARALRPSVRVFDCMDDLGSFKYAPPELPERDRDAMRWADVVFTGGPSIYESRRHQHSNIHCIPSSVDARHFARALLDETPEADDQKCLRRPILGYFGVIDERMDLDVLTAMAQSHPEWTIVLLGPIVKIKPENLPRFKNLHYLGQRRYESLPAYIKGWDVALIPFAMNDATRFISPTKVLEYMAAELPIVSAPIHDLQQFRSTILFGATPTEFVTQCERALMASESTKKSWATEMRTIVRWTSWDETARRMLFFIDSVDLISSAPNVAETGGSLPCTSRT